MLNVFPVTSDSTTPHSVFLPVIIVILVVAAAVLSIDLLIATIEIEHRSSQHRPDTKMRIAEYQGQLADQSAYLSGKAQKSSEFPPGHWPDSQAVAAAPLQQELMLIGLNPFVLPMVIAILLIAMFPRGKRSRDRDAF